MTVAEKICAALRTGENNAVSLADMCNISGLDNRHTRRTIENLRRKGTVICFSDKGYFYPENIAELRRYVCKERARENSINTTLQSAEELLRRWEWGI